MAITKIRGSTQIMDLSIYDAQIATAAAIATSKLAEGAEFVKRDGSVAFTGTLDMGGNKIVNGAEGTADTDFVIKSQLDALSTGLDVKQSVRALADSDVDILTGGLLTIDGVTLSDGDRVLLTGQTDPAENGIYVASAGAWSRAPDADNTPVTGEVTSGMFTFVEEGTNYANSGWVLTTPDPISLGTTALTFAQFSGAGQITAGDGLSKSGNVMSVNVDGEGLEIVSDQLTLELDGPTLSKSAAGLKIADAPASGYALISDATGAFAAVQLHGDISVAADGTVSLTAGSITDGDISDTAGISLSKLADGSSAGQMIVVGSDLKPAYQTISGDVSVAADGTVSIGAGVIDNANISDTAAIAHSKLAGVSGGQLLVGNASGKLQAMTITGDVSFDNAGVTSINNAVITNTHIAGNADILVTKLETLGDAEFIIGDGTTNKKVVMSGDATMDNTGKVTLTTSVVKDSRVVTRDPSSGVIDGTNKVFTLAQTPVAGTECVFLNGILQEEGAGNDYTISGATITFETAPQPGDKIAVNYITAA